MEKVPSFIPEYQELFNQMDKDKGGLIDYEEFMRYFTQLNCCTTEETKNYFIFLFKIMDKDKSNKISFKEFAPFARGFLNMEKYGKNNWKYLSFKTLDTDNSDSIGIEEVKCWLEYYGRSADNNSCKETIKAIDYDGDGSISFAEFCAFW